MASARRVRMMLVHTRVIGARTAMRQCSGLPVTRTSTSLMGCTTRSTWCAHPKEPLQAYCCEPVTSRVVSNSLVGDARPSAPTHLLHHAHVSRTQRSLGVRATSRLRSASHAFGTTHWTCFPRHSRSNCPGNRFMNFRPALESGYQAKRVDRRFHGASGSQAPRASQRIVRVSRYRRCSRLGLTV